MSFGYSRRGFIGTGIGAFAAPAIVRDNQERNRISRADLIYTKPVVRGEEGMPLGNGRRDAGLDDSLANPLPD